MKPKGLVDISLHGFIIVKNLIGEIVPVMLLKKTVLSLVRARGEFPEGYNFMINDGYRGYDEQAKLNKTIEKWFRERYPANQWKEKFNTFTGGEEYLETLRTQKTFHHLSHASGNAVDVIGIVDHNGNPINLGSQSDDIKMCKTDYYETKSSPKEIEIRNNRRLLKQAMMKNNFENYAAEWWHWGYKG